ncbi:chloride channel CLIC-like protein 1 [Daphnia carinata]|uniref:chloride channel CLIC-like protein 1 n=1 Tax=Daphnia carinata TaxID=120202 RepID=UPI00257C632E|nr:chloride channel CLIC-like protein 1 [Daphnia carinata]
MEAVRLVLVFSSLFLLTMCSEKEELYLAPDFTSIDRSNYVDPHDMLNYNRKEIQEEKALLKTSRDENIPQSPTHGQTDESRNIIEEVGAPNQVEFSEKSMIQSMPAFLNDKPVNCSSQPKNTALDIPFLGRFVKILTTVLQLKEKHIKDGDVLYIPLLAVVNARTQFVLNEITKEGEEIQLKHLADLDEILTNLLLPSKELECESNPSFVEMIFHNRLLQPKDCMVMMFVASLWFVFWLTIKGYSYSDILSRSFLPFFMICWFWNWNYMHQMASSKRYSDKSKNKDIPASCDPEQIGTLESLKLRFEAYWGYPDPCEEYHRVLLTDPSFEVNPFTVLWDMLVVGILHPLGYIGNQMGSFFTGVLNSATVFQKIPVIVCVLVVLFLLLVMTFRYEVHLPLFKIRPSQPVSIPRSGAIQDVMDASAIGDAVDRHLRIERSILTRQSHSQVQAVEERVQNPVEDTAESSTVSLPPAVIHKLGGSLPFNNSETESELAVEERVQNPVKNPAEFSTVSLSPEVIQELEGSLPFDESGSESELDSSIEVLSDERLPECLQDIQQSSKVVSFSTVVDKLPKDIL